MRSGEKGGEGRVILGALGEDRVQLAAVAESGTSP